MKNKRRPAHEEIVLDALPISPGIAIGGVYVHEDGILNVPEYCLAESAVQAELDRFTEAAGEAAADITRLTSRVATVPGAAGDELRILLDAYRQMLKGSRLIRNVQQRIVETRVNAEAAVQHEIGLMVEAFAAMDDAYLSARIDDVRDVGYRLIRALNKSNYRPFTTLPKNAVIVAESLTPADAAQIDSKLVNGFATVVGAKQSHTSIMARSLNIPAVSGVHDLMREARPRDLIIIDGIDGRVILRPTEATLEHYRAKQENHRKEERALNRLKRVEANTRDGVHINLQANVELPMEAAAAMRVGATGIGLLRTEFMFMNRPDLPDEEEQYRTLRAVVETMDGQPVTIRTLDIGSDKLGEAIAMEIGPNPALGLRAIRLTLKRPDLFETQLAAILRAGAHGPIRILLPMVSNAAEIRTVRKMLQTIHARLKRRKGIQVAGEIPPLGAMIEVPAAALAADALAFEADFFALGTNDLTQYTLAIDRSDEQVAELYDPLHPAVLKLIQMTVESALRARKPVSICGEMAGDERLTPLLLGLGIRDLSMSWNAIPKVKRRVRAMEFSAAVSRTRVIMEQTDPKRIARLIDEFTG